MDQLPINQPKITPKIDKYDTLPKTLFWNTNLDDTQKTGFRNTRNYVYSKNDDFPV